MEPKTKSQWQAAADLAALYRLLAQTHRTMPGHDDLRIDYLLGGAEAQGVHPAGPEVLMARYLKMASLPPLP